MNANRSHSLRLAGTSMAAPPASVDLVAQKNYPSWSDVTMALSALGMILDRVYARLRAGMRLKSHRIDRVP